MKRAKAFALTLMLIGTLVLVFGIQRIRTSVTNGKTYYVGPAPANFASIQEAIDNASVMDGDTIEVMCKPDPYRENVTVYKSLKIRNYSSWPNLYPIVDGGNGAGTVFNVTADGVEIDSLNIVHGLYGIFLHSSDNTLINDTLTSNGNGIYIGQASANNTLTGNNMSLNAWNFGITDALVQNINESNTVNGKPIYYWLNRHGEKIPSDAGYAAIINSTDMDVENLTFQNNNQGLFVADSSEIVVKDLECSFVEKGIVFANVNDSIIENVRCNYIPSSCISLSLSGNNSILNNKMSSNSPYTFPCGIYITNSTNNNITGNELSGLYTGVELEYSNGNTFFHNNFENNSPYQVYMVVSPNNSWHNGYEGNYWSDYQTTYHGNETEGTGIGNTPYNWEGVRDNCPLMKEWNPQTTIDANGPWYAPILTSDPSYAALNKNCTIVSSNVIASGNITLHWDSREGYITFNVTAGAPGFFNVTIPRDRLDSPFELYLNGSKSNSTYYELGSPTASNVPLYFQYPAGRHMVKIVCLRIACICGDINGDGVVNMKDIAICVNNFNKHPNP